MTPSKLGRLINLTVVMAVLFPIVVLAVWSLSRGWPADRLLPGEWGLRGWRYLFAPGGKMLASLEVSVFVSLTVTILGLLISIPAGRALGIYEFKGKRLAEILILTPLIIPATTVGMGIQLEFIRYGLTDTVLGVILAHLPLVLPYGIRVFASIYQALGTKWDEQAQILKAGAWQRFRYITLPFLYPGIISGGVLMFNVSLSQYFLTYLIGGGKVVTLPVLLFPFINSGDRVIAAGLGLVIIALSLIFMVIIEKMVGDPERQTNFYYL